MSDSHATTDDGVPLYVQTTSGWGKSHERLVEAASLKDAKAKFGWTRQQHTTVKVRRARKADVDRLRAAVVPSDQEDDR